VKVGDLVRWTHSSFKDVGIVIEIKEWSACIVWQAEPRFNGDFYKSPHLCFKLDYKYDHKYLEVISESR
jgi:hypothetical protein